MGGFGSEGWTADGKHKGWRGIENVNILAFETAPNVQILSRSWNKRAQGWLERYTYRRTGNSLLATYFLSAIWHGLYPGFFIFFMSVPLLTSIEREMKVKVNPLIVPGYDGEFIHLTIVVTDYCVGYNNATAPKTLSSYAYWFFCWCCTTIGVHYIVQVFSMGSWENSITALGSYHHIGHIAFVVIYGLLTLLPKPKGKDKTKAE